jgi:hypothetical protein
VIPSLAIAAAVLLLATPPQPAPAKGAKPPRDPDADVIEHLELLERMELLQHLDTIAPPPAPAREGEPRGTPPGETGAGPGTAVPPPPVERKGEDPPVPRDGR